MSKVRIVYKPDKSVAVIHCAPKSKLSENDAFAKATKEGGFEGLDYEDIDSTQRPDRKDRAGWEGEKGKGISINLAKVKVASDAIIRKQKIEAEKDKMAEERLKARGEIV